MNSFSRLTALVLICVLTAAVTAGTQDLYDEATVRDIELTFSQTNWWDLLYQNMSTETCIEADMVVDGVSYPQVGVRFKGNSSASVWPAEKMPFKIKTDEYVPDQKLYGYDTINLGNSFIDPTFTREVVTYHTLRKYMPAPLSNYVRLWLNGTYWGIYVNTEQVSGEFLSEWFEDTDGNRYKCDPTGPGVMSTLKWLGSNPALYYDSYELKSDPTGSEWTDLVDMIDVLNNDPVADHWTELAPVLFIDRCLWYLAACNLFCNLDSYIGSGHNYYMYNDPYEGRFSPVTWDTNEAFGNFPMIPGGPPLTPTQLQQLSPLLNYGENDYPLISQLLDPAAGIRGRQVYFAHFRDMLNEEWNWTDIGSLVQQYQDLIEQDVINDTKKLYSMSDFYSNVTQNVQIGNRTSCGLKPFVENRRSYLLNQSYLTASAPQISKTVISPVDPGPNDNVLVLTSVTVSSATLGDVDLYCRAGADSLYTKIALFDDGQHGDGVAHDGLFGNWIPAQASGTNVNYFILAQTTAQTVSLDPIYGENNPYSYQVEPEAGDNGVIINEFLARNNTVNQDEGGEYEDWIELYNENAFTVDLGGTYLTDDITDLTKWQIPAGTSITAGGTLLVWADNELDEGPLHASFKLDADGEEIVFVDSDGASVLDYYSFGTQAIDISTGRLFDGEEAWVTFPVPSPDTLNAPGTTGYRTYSALDSTANTLSLEATGTPVLSAPITFEIRNGPTSNWVVFGLSWNAHYSTYPSDAVLLIAVPPFWKSTLWTNSSGTVDLGMTIPNNPSLVGLPVFAQFLTFYSGPVEASNALETTIGP